MTLPNIQILAQVQEDGSFSVGVLTVTALIIGLPILLLIVWLKVDQIRHKRPLQEIDPNVKYTFWHHIKVVTIPMFSYRITFMVQKRK
ncbi:MAG: hypothetical protein H6793_02180 [Candidatus Nomurabacteria bacterium]|nr:MAG: hypothetical protein H6793_02180 [Candidatus Nomurabacteria bacterium]